MQCTAMQPEFDYLAFFLEFDKFLVWWFIVIYILFKLMDNIARWLNDLED